MLFYFLILSLLANNNFFILIFTFYIIRCFVNFILYFIKGFYKKKKKKEKETDALRGVKKILKKKYQSEIFEKKLEFFRFIR